MKVRARIGVRNIVSMLGCMSGLGRICLGNEAVNATDLERTLERERERFKDLSYITFRIGRNVTPFQNGGHNGLGNGETERSWGPRSRSITLIISTPNIRNSSK